MVTPARLFSAPSPQGQTDVIVDALEMAGVSADTIGYVEAHGTGTTLGDPIEVEALTRAFRRTTDRTGFCALGSVKSNIGHTDTAAGAAGMIKAILCLQKGQIPASLHFREPNPHIDFDRSPFFVNRELRRWGSADCRRACVSSFGIGGTNAHVVLEEAPSITRPTSERTWHLITMSARTPSALRAMSRTLGDYLADGSGVRLEDVAHTLQVGRHQFPYRIAVVGQNTDEVIVGLSGRPGSDPDPARSRNVVFLLTAQRMVRANVGRELYDYEKVFREEAVNGFDALKPRWDSIWRRQSIRPIPRIEPRSRTRSSMFQQLSWATHSPVCGSTAAFRPQCSSREAWVSTSLRLWPVSCRWQMRAGPSPGVRRKRVHWQDSLRKSVSVPPPSGSTVFPGARTPSSSLQMIPPVGSRCPSLPTRLSIPCARSGRSTIRSFWRLG